MVLPVAGEDPSACYLALDYKLFRADIVIYVNWGLSNGLIPSAVCGQKTAKYQLTNE